MGVKRSIVKSIRFFLQKYPIVALTGPRQSGKTTMLKNEFSDYTYINLEQIDARQFADRDPKAFLETYSSNVIFDEIQRVPELFSYIQAMVDESGQMGQFILSGSQNFNLMNAIKQSLAGRVALFKLLPFDLKELKSANLLPSQPEEITIRGCYPALFDRDIPSKNFYANYFETYVERDIGELLDIRDIRSFRNFVALCATRAAQQLNLNALARDCGISQPTAKSWLSVLQTSYVVFLLQPMLSNYGKRITKSPKLYFHDTGLLCHLLKLRQPENLLKSQKRGAVFENLAIAEMFKLNEHLNHGSEMWYWRDSAGHEVDLILENEDKLDIFECKASTTIMPNHFKGLSYFHSLAKEEISKQFLVYGGKENQKRTHEQVLAWHALDGYFTTS